ncbi:MAG: thioredoxin family protein [Pirellulales bacterium]
MTAGGAEIRWLTNLEQATEIARESDRMVLLHFWSTTCPPCVRLEQNVFSDNVVATGIEANFVPVKINVDEQRAIARAYNVRQWPTDVILSPQGEVIAVLGCRQDPSEYLSEILAATNQYRSIAAERIAASRSRPSTELQLSSTSGATPREGAGVAFVDVGGAPRQAQSETTLRMASNGTSGNVNAERDEARNELARLVGDRYASLQADTQPATVHHAPTPTVDTAAPRQPVAPRQENPPLALEGRCAVTIHAKREWVPGDPRFGAIHRGRTYLFAGPQEQQNFLTTPDRFMPVLGGHDPVVAVKRGMLVPGKIDFGIFHEDRVYLFVDEQTKDEFNVTSVDAIDRNVANIYEEHVQRAEAGHGTIRR